MRAKWIVVGLVVSGGFLLWRPAPQFDIHAGIQQRLLEAELGSATTFHFAGGTRARIPTDTTTDLLLTNLAASQAETRWQAAQELAVRREPRAVEAVIRAMRDPGGTLRVCVMASALGHLKDPRALSALTEAAFDPGNRDLRLCAIQSLGMIGDRRAVPALIEALKTGNNPVTAANAIARMGDKRGIEPMIEAAGDPQLRLWMVMALGELGSPEALPYLSSLVSAAKGSVRQAVAEAQWKIEQLSVPDPVQALSAALEQESTIRRRTWAAFRLGELGRPEAIPALVRALDDKVHAVQGRAAAALIRTGAAALPVLRTLLASASGPVRLYATAILGYAGNEEDIPLLQTLVASRADEGLAVVASRSIDLIEGFVRHDSGIAELASF